MSELNKQLLEAIENSVEGEEDEHENVSSVFGTGIAANECEKICLQAQIDLLWKVRAGLIQKGVINYWIKELEEQLKQLNQS